MGGGRRAAMIMVLAMTTAAPAAAEDFPFGLEMTLDALPMSGSKRVPSLEIDDNGEVRLELWCKGGRGQFSVAGDTVVFMPGVMEQRSCPAERAAADDALIAALTEATNWKRQGESVTFIGPKPLHFHLLSN